MAYGIRAINPNTGDVTLSENSYTTVFRGKATNTRAQLSFGGRTDPPFGMWCDYEITIPTDEPPLLFMSNQVGNYIGVTLMRRDASKWFITIHTSVQGFVPEMYCFQRMRWDEAVRGGYGMIIWGPDGRPVFSSNSRMLNPVAAMTVATPASNRANSSTGSAVRISNTVQSNPWPAGVTVPAKPIFMYFSPSIVQVLGTQPSATTLIGAGTVWSDRFDVSWAVSSFISRNATAYDAGAGSNIVVLADGATYD